MGSLTGSLASSHGSSQSFPRSIDLPVEVGRAAKRSGVQNLSREGWDEGKCRNFLIRLYGWVPRNFNYEDGLRILHPMLQLGFGDENLDLAIGVLEELIEVEAPTPFPAAVYQRWKHDHLLRQDNFQLPHTPHTSTIINPVQPTKVLIQWRLARSKLRTELMSNSPSDIDSAATSNTSTRRTLSSSYSGIFAFVRASDVFRREHSTYVSVGGGKATALRFPSPDQSNRNPAFRKPQAIVVERRLSFSIRRRLSARSSDTAVLDLDDHNEDLPPGVSPPNGIFARKYGIVPRGEPLPDSIFQTATQPTADDVIYQGCEDLWEQALRFSGLLSNPGGLEEAEKIRRGETAATTFLLSFEGPPTPDLFFDSGLDYSWGKNPTADEEQTVSWYKRMASYSRENFGTPDISPSPSSRALEPVSYGRSRGKSKDWSHNGSVDRFSILQPAIRHIGNSISGILKRTRSTKDPDEYTKHRDRASDISDSMEMQSDPVEMDQMSRSQETVSTDRIIATDDLILPSTVYKPAETLQRRSGDRESKMPHPKPVE